MNDNNKLLLQYHFFFFKTHIIIDVYHFKENFYTNAFFFCKIIINYKPLIFILLYIQKIL
jgi:hypothetical protein